MYGEGFFVKNHLEDKLNERVQQFVGRQKINDDKIEKKRELMAKRKAEIVKVTARGKVTARESDGDHVYLFYNVHLKYLIKQKGRMYIEEEMEQRKASFYKGGIFDDIEQPIIYDQDHRDDETLFSGDSDERVPFQYDRLQAVQYAERWWNDYNPAYIKFEVDCTNYVSQCLHAGGAPMRGYPNRTRGWWMQNNNWSFSWSVANALEVYLRSSTTGLRAKEVDDPLELQLGDVICYDFQGDGRFDHNTIVTGKDANGMPLVNAHTYNSRMRYWAYEDSTAYTPNIKYKMYSIVDDG